ncbi:MAG: hypothetical protein JWM37_456 [Candidatus Saccharibacteria bacterium]|nr:hypothetical protein [Candidatus Saccharibacteria bacterium]
MPKNNFIFERAYHRRKNRPKWRRLITAFVAIAVLGGVTFAIYRWFQGENEVSPSISSTIHQTVPVLKIPEWGVALQLDVSTSDTSHELIQANPSFIALSNTRLTDIARDYPACNNVNTNVRLLHVKPGDILYGQTMTEAHLKSTALRIGDYYYFIQKGASCHAVANGTDVYDEVNEIQTKLSKLYITAIPTD